MPIRQTRSPRTKEELLNKMLSFDFDGDIRTLGPETRIKRTAPNEITLEFPDIDRKYVLSVHIPREENFSAPIPPTPKRAKAKH